MSIKPNNYKDKKVLILGLGLNQGGVGSARFFAKNGAAVRVTDLKNEADLKPSLDQLKEFPKIEYILGEHRFEDIDWADLVIKNPALKPNNPYVQYALKKGKQLEMDMGIFLEFVSPKQIIGVTGTKGKSTTVSLIYEIFKTAGKKVVLGGNIRKSVLDILPEIKEDSIVVLELSSFQLESFQKHQVSPHIAVITNIFPDHLNYYGTMDKYIEAKRVIAQYQKGGDYIFLASHAVPLRGYQSHNNFTQGFQGQIKYFKAGDLPKNFQPLLPGEHNLENMTAALAAAQILGVNKDLALEVMKKFPGVEYRLQLIYNQDGVKIYNDSAATNPEATIQALQSLPNSILISGGANKRLSYESLAKKIDKYAQTVYFLEGDATSEIINYFKILNLKFKIIQGTFNNLEEILSSIQHELKKGDVILFSPAAASFNLFQNEFDRGQKFNEAVKKVFEKKG